MVWTGKLTKDRLEVGWINGSPKSTAARRAPPVEPGK